MDQDPPQEKSRARGSIRGWRALAVLAAVVALPVLAGAGLWIAADEHQIVPGLDGCRYVRDRAAQLDCTSDEISAIVADRGLQKALVRVDELAAGNSTIGADCHVGWHPTGERDGREDAKARRDYDNIAAKTTCQQGYAHGYTIGFIGEGEPDVDELARMVDAECGGSTDLNALFNCTHSYGHVIARLEDGDVAAGIDACGAVDYRALPGADVPSPVPGERAPVLVGAEHQCLYGMYMEVSLLDVDAGESEIDNCGTATTDAARKACYAYLPSRANAILGDLERAARTCYELAPKGDLRDSCVKTFSIGLQDRELCSMLVSADEQAKCRTTIDIRDNQDDLLALADGDPGSFDANIQVAPEPGVETPAPPTVRPDAAPPSK